jgi:hypothetical protein
MMEGNGDEPVRGADEKRVPRAKCCGCLRSFTTGTPRVQAISAELRAHAVRLYLVPPSQAEP